MLFEFFVKWTISFYGMQDHFHLNCRRNKMTAKKNDISYLEYFDVANFLIFPRQNHIFIVLFFGRCVCRLFRIHLDECFTTWLALYFGYEENWFRLVSIFRIFFLFCLSFLNDYSFRSWCGKSNCFDSNGIDMTFVILNMMFDITNFVSIRICLSSR